MKTEINIYILFSILFIHWVADFLFQTEWQAKNKSTSKYALTMHILGYSTACLLICNAYSILTHNYLMVALFPPITFICHWITDYFTSRWTSKLYSKKKYYGFPAFFSVIGFDQFLHYAQLIITFQLLM